MARPLIETNTYSIIAFDPAAQHLGAAMQTHNFEACNGVIWVQPGVGAVASQAGSDPFYAFAGFDLMRLGKTAEQTLASLRQCDADAPHNQVAIMDASGNVSAFTGERCIPEAGHIIGLHHACQANIMLKNTVWDAMSAAFEHAEGTLVDRIMCAMDVAEREGGDMRGAQSAAIKIASAKRPDKPWQGILYDFKVYDHPEPLQELRRLIDVKQAHQQTNAANRLLFEEQVDDNQIARSMKQFNDAVSRIPNLDSKLQHQCSYGLSLLRQGRVDDALSLLSEVFARDAVWRDVVARVIGVNPDMPYAQELDRILAP